MANSQERLRVFEDENGKRYAKQFTKDEFDKWVAAHPNHTVIR